MNSTQATLKINDLQIWANHGWYAEERIVGGLYRIDIVIGLEQTTTSLQLSDTVDYQDVVDLTTVVMKEEYKLIEDSCQAIFNAVGSMSQKIKSLEVTVTKLDIPINNLNSTSFTLKS
ncbi:MAG: dihydroneopterin aldolase [Bacteroidia bacterium]|jgi:dihydroneopterin aldolase